MSPSGSTYNNGSVTIAADSGAINGTWNGSVAGGTLSGAYLDSTAILLTATLPAGTIVSSWGIGCDSTTATTCSISSLTTDTTISPVFAPDTRALTVSPSGPTYSNGAVTISADSGAINGTWNGSATGGTLTGDYINGAAVVLTATLPAGTIVSSWGTGCDATTATTCTITSLSVNTTISPVFAVDTKTLTASPSGPTYNNAAVTIAADSGAVNGTWDGSATGGTLSDTYNYGTGIVLTVTLPAGTVVSSWGAGCDATTATTCTLNNGTLTSNTTISPVFAVDTKTLTVSPSGPTYNNGAVTIAADSGAVNGTWDGNATSGTLSDTYNYGTGIILTATLPAGTVVSSWGAGCDATTATTCTITSLSINTTISPVFALDARTLTVSPSGPTYNNAAVTIAADSGAVNGTWDGSATGGTLSDTYNYGTGIVLTATLPAGTVVSSWGTGCDATTATTCTITSLSINTTISPVFALDTRTLTVSPSGPTYNNAAVTIAADSGAVNGTWDGSVTGGTLSDTYNYGTGIVLTATLPASTVVSSWGAGCDATTATTCTLNNGTLTSNTTISPVFAENNAPTFTGTPTISGIATVGKTLSLLDTLTDDSDGDTVTLSYQWAADSVDIPDANSDNYILTKNEAQKNVTCTLTADDGNGGIATFTTVGVDVGNSFPWPMFLPAITSHATH
ncbi:MAG: hypothetical protein PHZ02_03245 [Desulfocapsaceae bacterium]|nr:hypothetical protein [Desulfocapsaceae bacterium]